MLQGARTAQPVDPGPVAGTAVDNVRTHRRRTFVRLFLVSTLGWAVFAVVVAPALLRMAAASPPDSFLGGLLASQTSRPIEYILVRWGGLARWTLVALTIPAVVFATWIPPLSGSQPRGHRLDTAIVGVFSVLLGAAVAFVFWYHPVVYVHFITEGWWAEFGTFASYAATAVLLAWAFYSYPSARKPGHWLLAAAAAFIAMEEIAWGQALLGLKTPEFLRAVNYQGQLTLHNMVPLPTHAAVGVVLLLGSLLLPWAAKRFTGLEQFLSRWGVPLVPPFFLPVFLLAAVSLVLPQSATWLKSDEVAELFLSLAVLSIALFVAVEARPSSSTPRWGLHLVATMLVVGGVTVGLVHFGAGSTSWRLNDFAARRFPAIGLDRHAEAMFRYLNEHPDLKRPQTFLREADFLESRGKMVERNRVLESGLVSTERLALASPEDADPLRNRVAALRMLGRTAEMEDALAQAIRLDEEQLTEDMASDPNARRKWSIAQTYVEANRLDEAWDSVVEGCSMATRAATRRQITLWINAQWPDQSPPPGCRVI